MAEPNDEILSIKDLPITFKVKYLGDLPTKGLWGIKHTRRPVDALVKNAKNLPEGVVLPFVKLRITKDGLSYTSIVPKCDKPVVHSIEAISYVVQDMVYTRVFSMIVVTDTDWKLGTPFQCHAFVCDSGSQAKRVTYALAAAFKEYGKGVKDTAGITKKFAIDLRTPDELEQALKEEETDA